MKKFKFKLEPLLKIRRFEEKQKYVEFSKILLKYNETNFEIQNADTVRIANLKKESVHMTQNRFDLSSVVTTRNYLKQIAMKKSVAERKKTDLTGEYQSRLNAANQSRIQRKTLEILKEKKLKVYNDELNQAEVKMLDDFNQSRMRKEKLQ